jgi:hypothetical protein
MDFINSDFKSPRANELPIFPTPIIRTVVLSLFEAAPFVVLGLSLTEVDFLSDDVILKLLQVFLIKVNPELGLFNGPVNQIVGRIWPKKNAGVGVLHSTLIA